MPVRYDPILGKAVQADPSLQELETSIMRLDEALKGINKTRSININFYDDTVEATWHNLIGDISLSSVALHNIAFAYISDGMTLTKANLVNLLANGKVYIPYGAKLTFEIQKSSTGNSALTIAFT